MTKKAYSKPVVKRVRLDLKTSVLVECRLSLSSDMDAGTCKQDPMCAM